MVNCSAWQTWSIRWEDIIFHILKSDVRKEHEKGGGRGVENKKDEDEEEDDEKKEEETEEDWEEVHCTRMRSRGGLALSPSLRLSEQHPLWAHTTGKEQIKSLLNAFVCKKRQTTVLDVERDDDGDNLVIWSHYFKTQIHPYPTKLSVLLTNQVVILIDKLLIWIPSGWPTHNFKTETDLQISLHQITQNV